MSKKRKNSRKAQSSKQATPHPYEFTPTSITDENGNTVDLGLGILCPYSSLKEIGMWLFTRYLLNDIWDEPIELYAIVPKPDTSEYYLIYTPLNKFPDGVTDAATVALDGISVHPSAVGVILHTEAWWVDRQLPPGVRPSQMSDRKEIRELRLLDNEGETIYIRIGRGERLIAVLPGNPNDPVFGLCSQTLGTADSNPNSLLGSSHLDPQQGTLFPPPQAGV